MKKLNILIAALIFINCSNQFNEPDRYIEFVHEGYTTHPYKTLCISSKKIDIKFNDEQLSELKHLDSLAGDSGSVSDKERELDIKILYQKVVTDEKTFSTMYNFLIRHKEFYTDLEYLRNHPIKESFEVIIDGNQELYVNEKLKNQLVNELIYTLEQIKGDENIIKEISHWRQKD